MLMLYRYILQHYRDLCAIAIPASTNLAQLSPQECLDLFGQGLAAAASIQQKSVKDATMKTKATAARELGEWLQLTGNRTMLTVTPEDILVYFTQNWLPAHAGSATACGEMIAAPSSLAGTKSHLATAFEAIGRIGTWDPVTSTGNPMHSKQVKDLLRGYANQATELGYQKKGAVPLTEAENAHGAEQHTAAIQEHH